MPPAVLDRNLSALDPHHFRVGRIAVSRHGHRASGNVACFSHIVLLLLTLGKLERRMELMMQPDINFLSQTDYNPGYLHLDAVLPDDSSHPIQTLPLQNDWFVDFKAPGIHRVEKGHKPSLPDGHDGNLKKRGPEPFTSGEKTGDLRNAPGPVFLMQA
ncbi:hypothetical protein VTO42DRAFT_6564 [Malbranchea cinnamomea]